MGLGNGIYPKDETPKLPVHPHCLCHLAPVFSSELDKKPTDCIEAGGREYLNQLSHKERMQLMGGKALKNLKKGLTGENPQEIIQKIFWRGLNLKQM